MPNIELGPEGFSRRDPKTGKLQRRLSKRFCRNYAVACAVVLCVIFWHRGEGDPTTEFGVTVLFAFVAGIMAQEWLRDIF